MAESGTRKVVQAKQTGNAANVEIIARGDNGAGNKFQRVVIDFIMASMTAAGTFSLENSDDSPIIPAIDLAAGIPLVLGKDVIGDVLQSKPGQGVELLTTGGTNTSYAIGYHYEP